MESDDGSTLVEVAEPVSISEIASRQLLGLVPNFFLKRWLRMAGEE